MDDYLSEALTMMRRISSGETTAHSDAEVMTMLLAGIGQQLLRIADSLDG